MRGEVLESRYRLVEMLGAGGMGQVWRAVDSRLDRDVAVKVITQSALTTSQSAARFRQEARATARLTHPSIVTIHDHGEAALGGHQVLFLVMELVPGRSMASFAATERRSVEDVVAWGRQICAGLSAAHRAGVVHRDIKPANVMVYGDSELDLKICDFGIARLIEESGTGLTGPGATIGTPAYMSPEQVRGDRTLDGRSDLYSLGCLLYELLSGRPPFEGAGWSVLAQHLNRTPEPVRNLRPGIPDALDRLVLRLLDKAPNRRPATAEEVSERLRDVLDDLGNAPPAVRKLAGAPTVDAPRAPGAEPPRRADPLTEPDPRADQLTAEPDPPAVPLTAEPGLRTDPPVEPATQPPASPAVPGAGRVSAWNGLLAATSLWSQFALLTDWSPVWTVALCAAVFLAATAVAYLGAPTLSAHDDNDPDICLFAMALLCTLIGVAFLVIWPPSPWWTALLFGVLGGPLLWLGGVGVCKTVAAVVPGAPWQTAAGTAVGLLNGVVLAGLLAAGGVLSVPLAIQAGAAAWVAAAALVTLLLPSV
ncbi:serine/threonine-protein kinase [Streptomyces sp. NBC_00385]|uniref:serine/threonine-protein kinase n=1 Tax=Streptomyces sp. NBC_00385 TaxID=2975733 RepID=UPI002DD8A265|nr:protein kinase [Streptomyces sp. NBC_00385]WRZ02946.1 protein kinase [Streptomyces sp. NBC_00385]